MARMGARVFVNGQVFDGRRHLGTCAVATDSRRIVAVGDETRVREAVGRTSEVVDLRGGLLLPGFIDAHMHPVLGGLERLHCELMHLDGVDDYLDAIRKHNATLPEGVWFRGGGWSTGAFGSYGPNAADLDAVVPDRPAFIPSSDHHNAWVNTRALEVAGVTAETPDPSDGWIERDDAGRPTGTLREAAMAIVGDTVITSAEEYHQALREAEEYLFSLGITGWHDALIGGYAGIDDPTPAYLAALEASSLTARVRASMWWDRHRGVEQVDELVAWRDRLAERGLDAGSVKIMMDGVTETLTATVTEPYVDAGGCPCGDDACSTSRPSRPTRRCAHWTRPACRCISMRSVTAPSTRHLTPWRSRGCTTG